VWPRREGELFELPKRAGGPFGEEPEPWWRSKPGGAPTRYTAPLGLLSGLLATGSEAQGAEKMLILPFAVGAPVLLLDWWWRARSRREKERVLP
jgi:hypothetical protein